MKKEKHYLNRVGWIRAAILGANDGILSTVGIIIGVAAAAHSKETIVLAGIAGLVAGALSMATGEYVSVSSQMDIENSDVQREITELEKTPKVALIKLAETYENKGVDKALSLKVAQQITAHSAITSLASDKAGLTDVNRPNPLQAALASCISFISGAIFPVLITLITPINQMIYVQYVFAIVLLIILGGFAAKMGGSNVKNAVLRITFWGTFSMVATALIGYFFGIHL